MFATKQGLYTREDFVGDIAAGKTRSAVSIMLEQADELALVCELAMDSAAYDGDARGGAALCRLVYVPAADSRGQEVA